MNNKFLIAGCIPALYDRFRPGISRSGKPFNTLLLTIHKLISLGALIYLAVTIFQTNRFAPLSPTALIFVSISAVIFITLFATGGMISAMKTALPSVSNIHKILPYLLAASTITGIYLAGM